MKIFRSSGTWMFVASVIYLAYGMYCLYNKDVPDYAGAVYIVLLSFPFWMPPFGRWINMDVTWDQSMFNFFKKKPNNVVPFPSERGLPEAKSTPPMPEVKPPAQTFYTLGMTSEQRLEFKIGHSAITMNYGGVSNLMDQLEVFKNQLAEYEKESDNG